MKSVTILSGKGGVGKSSIAASLAIALSRRYKIICADCDVDASNLSLVFGLKEKDYMEWKGISTNKKARLIPEKCIGCKKCLETCYFDAISWDGKNKKPIFKEFGCEGCRACEIVCPNDAIELFEVNNAKIGYVKTKYGFLVVSSQLEMGESGSGKVVSAVKGLAKLKSENADIILIDAAAGIGCPVIASVAGSDYAIAVTEPTPSGFSDLKRALGIVNHFGIPKGIIINKFDLNPKICKLIESFAMDNGIKVIAKIPYDKKFLNALIGLVPIIEYDSKFETLFNDIASKLAEEIF